MTSNQARSEQGGTATNVSFLKMISMADFGRVRMWRGGLRFRVLLIIVRTYENTVGNRAIY